MASDYKASKEAFVSGISGSTVLHVNMISAVALASIALHSSLRTRFLQLARSPAFLVEWLSLIAPLLLSMTLFAETPVILLSLLVLCTAAVLFLFPRRESGTPLPSNADISPRNSSSPPSGFISSSSTEQTAALAPLPALSTYRAHMMLMTILAILSVDFPVFPRYLVKCETFGVSLMDLGVGSFVFSQGVVSAIPILKDPRYLTSPYIPKFIRTVRKCMPILALGLVRVLLVKGTEYPEHETEYGVHWNFFLTLASIPVLQVLLHPLIMKLPISLIGGLLALAQQFILSVGLQDYVINAPRTTLISANKEGIVSLPGYLAIHLLGLSTGTYLLPPTPSYFRRRQKAENCAKHRDSNPAVSEKADRKTNAAMPLHREDDKTAIELFSYAFIWWTSLGACMLFDIGGGVSRRIVNLPYVVWVAAFNVTFLLGYLTLDLAFFPSPLSHSVYSPTSKLKVNAGANAKFLPQKVQADVPTTPPLLEAVSRNGLAIFLLSNVVTGMINLSMETMYASTGTSMVILTLYALGVCGFAWAVRERRLWTMLFEKLQKPTGSRRSRQGHVRNGDVAGSDRSKEKSI